MLLLEVSVFPVAVFCRQFQRYCLTENLCNCQSLGQTFIFLPHQPTSRMYMCLGEGLLSSDSNAGSWQPAVLLPVQAMGKGLSSHSDTLGSRQLADWHHCCLWGCCKSLLSAPFLLSNCIGLVTLLSYCSCAVT